MQKKPFKWITQKNPEEPRRNPDGTWRNQKELVLRPSKQKADWSSSFRSLKLFKLVFLQSRPVNPIVYLVQKSESEIQKYLLCLLYLFRMCSMWQSGYLLVDDLRVLWCFCKALPQNTIIMSYFAWPPTPASTLASSRVIFPQTSGWHLLMTSYLDVPLC